MRFWKLFLGLIVFGVLFLFAPIPFVYQEQTLCQPCDPSLPQSQCPKCPQKGDIGWRPPLFRLIIWKLRKSKEGIPPSPTTPGVSIDDLKVQCKQSGGKWLEKFRECENIDRKACEFLKGVFSECESPCRHNPDAAICITVCVRVCTLP